MSDTLEIIELNDEIVEKDKEIERLNKEIEQYKYSADELNEINRLNNIIKEVKEKIENTTINCEGIAEDLLDDIYEILDKGE